MKRKLAKRFVVALIVAIPVWTLLLVLLFMLHAMFYSTVSDFGDAWDLVKINTALLAKRIVLLSLIFAAALVLTDTRK
jgi:hypothetical protein